MKIHYKALHGIAIGILFLFLAQTGLAPCVYASNSAYKRAAKEKRFTKNLFKRRWKEFAKFNRPKIQNIFRDGKIYYNARLYKDAVAIWYEILLKERFFKYENDDNKVESLINNAQVKIKEWSAKKKRLFELKAQREKAQ